jgi:hypothetical protein
MNNAWRWLMLAAVPACLLVPSCLLVQPLDEAKTDAEASAGNGTAGASTSHAGAGTAGRAPTGGGGAHAAGSGPTAAGASSGGAPSGVDFSLFTGTWKITSGSRTSYCGTAAPETDAIPAGGIDVFTLGTTSDLILDEATTCPILVDVDDRVATGQDTQYCMYTGTDGYDYDVFFQSYTFEVLGNGTADSTLSTVSVITDPATMNTVTCTADATFKYSR